MIFSLKIYLVVWGSSSCPQNPRLKIKDKAISDLSQAILEQSAILLNRSSALILCFCRNFCPKTASHFSEIACIMLIFDFGLE